MNYKKAQNIPYLYSLLLYSILSGLLKNMSKKFLYKF